ncbi:hypothetical protein NSA16_09880 [Ligilactobacillus murinus]|nr:hypothetical protein [Ligilactobacillus murinus]
MKNEMVKQTFELKERNAEYSKGYGLFVNDFGNIKKHKISIFYILFDSTYDLLQKWEKYNNDIAYEYQAELEKDIERFNIYCFYFVGESVPLYEKVKIEQDKYSTRKFVIDNINIDDKIDSFIEKTINDKLFDLEVTKIDVVDSIKFEYDNKVYKLVEELEKANSKNYKRVIDKFIGGNEI